MRYAPALLLLCLAAPPAAAGNYSLTGSVGGGFSRDDTWIDAGHRGGTTWDWDADLALAGSPFRPEILQLMLEARYQSIRSLYFDSRSWSDGLGFNGQAAILSGGPLSLTLNGARTTSDFTTDGDAQRTGSNLNTTLGATALLRVREYPSLRVSLLHTDLQNHSFGAGLTDAGSTGLSVAAAHSTRTQDYSAEYDTAWNHGTWAEDNYRSHAATLMGTVGVTDHLVFRLYDRYYLRLPTNAALTNPRYDDNALGTGLQWRPGTQLTASLDYDYRHLLVSHTFDPDLEQTTHQLTQATYYRLSPSLSLQGLAAVDLAERRWGSLSRQGSGERAGGSVLWHRALSPRFQLNASAGSFVGADQPYGQTGHLGYGVSSSLGGSMSLRRLYAYATYSGTYQQNTTGLGGSSLSQNFNTTAETTLGPVFLRGAFVASGTRRDDPLLGTLMSRAATLNLNAAWRRYSAQLVLGESDGLSQALWEPGASDGLFLPPAFNTHSRYATVSSTVALDQGRFTVTALARALAVTAPARPEQYEYAAALNLNYSIGQLVLSAINQWSRGGLGSSEQMGNLIMVRATRTFGASW